MGIKIIGNQIVSLKPVVPVFYSKSMIEVWEQIMSAAGCDSNVLLLGETGTGKTYFGRKIHELSMRSKTGNFVYINCSAIQKSIIVSELFGNIRGAFTGADFNRKGLIKHADGGTIFFDEIGTMKKFIQKILLSLVDFHEFCPVGSEDPTKSDFRVICATNEDIDHRVKKGKFRLDLLSRINVIKIKIPPLRERMEDLPCLVRQFLDELNLKSFDLSPQLWERFNNCSWPENVRQLRIVLETACNNLKEGDTQITLKHIPKDKLENIEKNIITPVHMPLRTMTEQFELEKVEEKLKYYNGDRKKVIDDLDINEAKYYRILKRSSGKKKKLQI